MLHIYETSLQLVDDLNPMLDKLARSKGLQDQLERALSSVVLNIAEGCGQSGGHRRERYKTALGSAREVRAIHDYVTRRRMCVELDELALDRLAKIIGTLVNLTR